MRILIALLLMSGVAHGQIDGVIMDYATAPAATEAELFDRAVVALRGRLESKQQIADAGATSVYTLRVLELLKSDGRASVGGLIDVHRHGGLNVRNQELGFEPFEIGDEVVLFLERARNGWYWPLNGPDGAFKLTKEGRAHAYGKVGAVSKKQAGRSVGEFMTDLRKHKK